MEAFYAFLRRRRRAAPPRARTAIEAGSGTASAERAKSELENESRVILGGYFRRRRISAAAPTAKATMLAGSGTASAVIEKYEDA